VVWIVADADLPVPTTSSPVPTTATARDARTRRARYDFVPRPADGDVAETVLIAKRYMSRPEPPQCF
jgi:hypothetical protein